MMRFAGTCALLISMSLILPSSASVISNKQTANVDAQTAMVEAAPKCISKKTLALATATTVGLIAGAYYFDYKPCVDTVDGVSGAYQACMKDGDCMSKVKSLMPEIDITSLPGKITAIPGAMMKFVSDSCDPSQYTWENPAFAMKRAGAAVATLVGLNAVFDDCDDSDNSKPEPKQRSKRQYTANVEAEAPVIQVSPQSAAEQRTLREKIQRVQQQLDIPNEMVKDLVAWAGTKIIVLADDSGSMNELATDEWTDLRPPMTRWEELQSTLKKLSEILMMVGADGFDLFFLNRPGLHRIHSTDELEKVFKGRKPGSTTPLYRAINKAIEQRAQEGDTLIMVMTDGVDDNGFGGIKYLIKNKPKDVYFSFMMCTNDDDVVEQYNQHVDPIPGVDVCDDFQKEKEECWNNAKVKLNFNMYLTKAVIGPKFPKWDNLDEKPRTGLFR